MNIDMVVANAIEYFPEQVGLKLITDAIFITHIEEQGVPVQDERSGLFSVKIAKYAIVDFTKPMTYNIQEFVSHSEYLTEYFASVKKWYPC